MPSKEVALRNALACATLEKAKAAVGWLETASREGLDNLVEVMRGKEFESIRHTEIFQKFLDKHLS